MYGYWTKTPAFELLKHDDFKNIQANAFEYSNYETMENKLKSIHGSNLSIYQTPEKIFEGDSKTGLWAIISQNFAKETTGAVRIMTETPRPNSVLVDTEIPELLKKNGLTVSNIPIEDLRKSGNPVGTIIAAASFESAVGELDGRYDKWLSLDSQDKVALAADNAPPSTLEEARKNIGELEGQFGKLAGKQIFKNLPLVGHALLILSVIATQKEAEAAGDSERAKEIWIEFAVEEAGSEAASTVAMGVSGIALALLAGSGAAVSAPVALAATFAVGIVAGIYGGDAAKDLYRLTKDLDGNGRRDLFDRLATLAFGQELTPAELPEALKDSAVSLQSLEMDTEAIIQAAQQDDALGIALHYALRELSVYLAVGADYEPYNRDGTLSLQSADNPGGMTENYIRDRAEMLVLLTRYLQNGLKLSRDLVDDQAEGDTDYIDLGQKPFAGNPDRPLTLSVDGRGISYDDRKIIFGTASADKLIGYGGNDALFGAGTGLIISGNDEVYLQSA